MPTGDRRRRPLNFLSSDPAFVGGSVRCFFDGAGSETDLCQPGLLVRISEWGPHT